VELTHRFVQWVSRCFFRGLKQTGREADSSICGALLHGSVLSHRVTFKCILGTPKLKMSCSLVCLSTVAPGQFTGFRSYFLRLP
jgi:hypothetical protein